MAGQQGPGATALRPTDPAFVGPYRLAGRLGEGGMGTVYLAEDRGGRLVAVKVVRPELAADVEFRQRFRSEVRRARQVPPFCTAEVLDADPEHATPYLVVEFVDGPSLADAVQSNGPLTAANLHAVAIGVATALTAIHAAGVIHRDLKPRNVLLAPGSPKVIDFGIARAADATTRLTQSHRVLGTVAYLAPERFDSRVDPILEPAADIFAWGGVIAFAGTGREPFRADSAVATAARILTQPPDLEGLPPALRDLVSGALAKDPAARPTARDLLDGLLAMHSPAADATAVLRRQPQLRAAVAMATRRPARRSVTAVRHRRRALATIAGLVMAALVGVGVVQLAAEPVSNRPAGSAPAPGPAGAPAGTASGPPASAPPRSAPAGYALAGDWVGALEQSTGSVEPIHLRLNPDGNRGAVAYPRLGCRGEVTVTQRSADRVTLEERITAGSCTSRGRITLWPTGPTTMLLYYVPNDGGYVANATMNRRPSQ